MCISGVPVRFMFNVKQKLSSICSQFKIRRRCLNWRIIQAELSVPQGLIALREQKERHSSWVLLAKRESPSFVFRMPVPRLLP